MDANSARAMNLKSKFIFKLQSLCNSFVFYLDMMPSLASRKNVEIDPVHAVRLWVKNELKMEHLWPQFEAVGCESFVMLKAVNREDVFESGEFDFLNGDQKRLFWEKISNLS